MRPCLLAVAIFPAIIAAAGIAAQPAHAERYVVLASTTSVENSGLLARILPQFEAQTGIRVRVVAQGTGQALATAAHGDADVVLVHDPAAEAAFLEQGHGVTRRQIAWNDFVLLGPAADPAHVGGTHDIVAAFRRIAAGKSPFVSRGDRSGTDAFEKRLWKQAGIEPKSSWYKEIGGGMGADLNMAAATDAYTVSDRGTWLSFANKRSLAILVEGGRDLLNRYDVITLNPAEHASERTADAAALADWLAGPQGQSAIASDEVGGQKLFHPMSDPEP